MVELFDKHKAAAGYADFSVRLVDKKNVLGKKSTAAEDKKTQ